MSNLYFEGVVDTWIGDGRNFGFITYLSSGREQRIFFPGKSIRLDAIGCRNHRTFKGALVRFTIDEVFHKGQSRVIATDVHPVFQDQIATSINEHREVSEVVRINSGRQSVWLRREDGSEIFFHKEQVVPEHFNRFENLRIADYVYHGVHNSGENKWRATFAEIFSREEQEKLQRGESLETEPALVAVSTEPEPVPEVLAPANRSKTFSQLALERKLCHELSPSIESTKP
jgi:hypothetical protein